ncbi:hypothetical protein HJC23_002853 [Cyclotella cryptica]|uniref:Uncharacterized protein n=1 Tax=Cyclotella cryptica TaxID=29204 RepID=A0ABD3P7V3_9STRA
MNKIKNIGFFSPVPQVDLRNLSCFYINIRYLYVVRDPSILEIYPPFRFQLGETPGSSVAKQTIVESQSDADFRAVNARTTEAQMAPKNEYEQLYLEDFGGEV